MLALMGMFDNLTCKYPLPVDGANGLSFQTKDTSAQYMDKYEIREDGTLWHEAYDIIDRSDPAKEGLERIKGMLSHENIRWEPDDHTGQIYFYTNLKGLDGMDNGWISFMSFFSHGKLIHLELIEHTLPKEKATA